MAGGGAAATCFRTDEHHLIAVGKPFAILRACLANVGADATNLAVELRHPQHKVRTLLATLSAIEQ